MDSNLLNDLLALGLEERTRKSQNYFLEELRTFAENLFEEDVPPKVIKEKLLQHIDELIIHTNNRYYK